MHARSQTASPLCLVVPKEPHPRQLPSRCSPVSGSMAAIVAAFAASILISALPLPISLSMLPEVSMSSNGLLSTRCVSATGGSATVNKIAAKPKQTATKPRSCRTT